MAQEKKALTVADTLTEVQKEVIEMGRPMKLNYNAKGGCRNCKAFKTLMKKGVLRKPCSVCNLGNRCTLGTTKYQTTIYYKKPKRVFVNTPTATLTTDIEK